MRTPGNTLPTSFYNNPDVVDVSKQLLGKLICTNVNSQFTSGIITETEAYCGRNDKACHANNGKRTPRTEVMFGDPGHAYVYLCYGIHHLFNVVTNQNGLADAVLVRAVFPVEGIEIMRERRNMANLKNLTNGPGKFTQAMGITTDFNSYSLSESPLWIEDCGLEVPKEEILTSKRIGIDYAEEDADRLWRFQIPHSLIS
jgi:DNA-3-methyladenine glycosylase